MITANTQPLTRRAGTPLASRLSTLALLLLAAATSAFADEKPTPVVRVNVTTQGWDFLRPWGKRQPVTRRAIGAVIEGNHVLVAGELVANSTYLELETTAGGKKVPASVEFVDYEANLALLKTDDADFLKDIAPIEIAEATTSDQLSVWQLENSGRLLVTNGPMTTAEVAPYPVDGAFLIYRMTVQMQNRDSSFTMPVVKGGKLTGILMSYEAQSNNANIIPAPIIQHFLKDAADAKYDGFPRAGYAFSPMRDPALRRFAKIPADTKGGIYITEVVKDSPAAKGGLQKGDVLLAVDDSAVDQDGNFADFIYGKIPLGHLINAKHYVGDTLAFHILRDGERQTLQVTLAHRDPATYVSDPYIIDKAPRFYIVGGLILQELSREFLKSFGPEWVRRAPERAVYQDRYQSELYPDSPRKVVFLTRVLPTPTTVGYEELNSLRVTKINGVELQSLDDVPKALEKAEKGLHKIEFDDDPGTIYLDAAESEKIERMVQMQYRIPTLKRLE